MKRHIGFSLLAIVLATSGALAGYKMVSGLWLDTKARFAQGTFSDTRASTSTIEGMTCSIQVHSGQSSMDCVACTDTECGWCYSYDKAMIEALHAVNGDSWVRFAWNESGLCTDLYVSQSSLYTPKQP